MRSVMTLATLVLFGSSLAAQERIPQEEAIKYSRLLTETAAKDVKDAPVKTDVDTERPYAVRHGEVGAMISPDRNLTAEVLAKAGEEPVPVGHLWFRKLTPSIDGQNIADDRLRLVTITVDNQDHILPIFLLSARKKGDQLELLIHGKNKEPLAVVPLKKHDVNQELPIELDGKKQTDDTGLIFLNVLGKYQAQLTVGGRE
jgi:hypothetical protein